METDASIQGLGAVLSQLQDSGDITEWHMPAELSQQQREDMPSQSLKYWLSCGQCHAYLMVMTLLFILTILL